MELILSLIHIFRYWDKEGNYTDTNVQINGVNPRNASYLEMLAYTTYSDVEGFMKNAFGDFMNAARGVNCLLYTSCIKMIQ